MQEIGGDLLVCQLLHMPQAIGTEDYARHLGHGSSPGVEQSLYLCLEITQEDKPSMLIHPSFKIYG